MSLWSAFLNKQGRSALKWKHYFSAYEAHFSRFVNRPVLLIEIGCGNGGSLQLWKQYLGPHARIVGLDIDPRCARYDEDQIEVRIGAQQDIAFLERVVTEFGSPDIVVDDGSHLASHVSATFGFLYPRTSPTGVYMIEDTHTSYFPDYEGGYRRPGTVIELCKDLIDQLNADHSLGARPPTEFTRSTLSIHIYDSLVAFERGRHTTKKMLEIPKG